MNLQTVKFHNDILEVIESGKRWISVNRICENLGISTHRQIKKLKSEPAFEAHLIEAPTAGGMQKVFCIPLEKLNGWLFTINTNKVKPEVREKLIAYKNECFKVLYDHFLKKAAQSRALPENFDKRISGYKGQLAKRKKEAENLRIEVALWKEETKIQKEQAKKNRELMEHFRQMAGFQVYRMNIVYDSVDKLKKIRSALTDAPKAYQTVSEVIDILESYIKKADEYVQFLQIPPLTKKITCQPS